MDIVNAVLASKQGTSLVQVTSDTPRYDCATDSATRNIRTHYRTWLQRYPVTPEATVSFGPPLFTAITGTPRSIAWDISVHPQRALRRGYYDLYYDTPCPITPYCNTIAHLDGDYAEVLTVRRIQQTWRTV
jgi:hypothetical protein